MTEGPSTRDEALALVATITARALRRAAAYDAAQAIARTRRDRPRKAGPTDTNPDRPLAKENARAQHDNAPVREGGGQGSS